MADLPEIKDLVKDGKRVRFTQYRGGNLYYQVDDFRFPVPITDIGDATFLAEDKALLFMRYIRKEIEARKEDAKEGNQE